MTRALVVFAQPCAESFSAALHATVVGALSSRGWEVDDCDLYAEGFDPVMRAEERRGYHGITVTVHQKIKSSAPPKPASRKRKESGGFKGWQALASVFPALKPDS